MAPFTSLFHTPEHFLQVKSPWTKILPLLYGFGFFLYGEENVSITNQFYYIFKRHFMFQNLQYILIANYVYIEYIKKKDRNPKNNSKFLWGLLTSNERKNFIKKYVDYN